MGQKKYLNAIEKLPGRHTKSNPLQKTLSMNLISHKNSANYISRMYSHTNFIMKSVNSKVAVK